MAVGDDETSEHEPEPLRRRREVREQRERVDELVAEPHPPVRRHQHVVGDDQLAVAELFGALHGPHEFVDLDATLAESGSLRDDEAERRHVPYRLTPCAHCDSKSARTSPLCACRPFACFENSISPSTVTSKIPLPPGTSVNDSMTCW